MSWLRDTFKALGWAILAAGFSIAVAYSGLVHGLAPLALSLVAAPFLAFRFHHSQWIAWLVAGWILVILAAVVLFIIWEFRDFHFRAMQG